MISVNKENKQEVMAFIPAIKANLSEWQLITIRLANINLSEPKEIQKRFLTMYDGKEGLSFITNDSRIILIVRLGRLDNYTRLKSNIEKEMDGHRCRVIVQRVNEVSLNQVSIDLSDSDSDQKQTFYNLREDRKQNVILIAEDDEFIRKTLNKLLSKNALIYEVEDGKDVLEAYKKHNPDITILDIHMPNKNGLKLMGELYEQDYDAFIIVSSADSVKQNVLETISRGAAGFLAKPIQKDRLSSLIEQCITYTSYEKAASSYASSV